MKWNFTFNNKDNMSTIRNYLDKIGLFLFLDLEIKIKNKLFPILVLYSVEQVEIHLLNDDQLILYQLEKYILLNVQREIFAFVDQVK